MHKISDAQYTDNVTFFVRQPPLICVITTKVVSVPKRRTRLHLYCITKFWALSALLTERWRCGEVLTCMRMC